MPVKPPKICSYPGCGNLTKTRYCPKHAKREQKRYDKNRGTAAQRGYDHRWQKTRKHYLSEHPLCVECAKLDKVVPATVVDHIVPHKGDTALFWDRGNWQALCARCHNSHKQRQEKGAGYNSGVSRQKTG